MFRRKVKFAQTQEGFNKQAETFLSKNGFPTSPEYKKLYAAFVQHMPEHQDTFNPTLLARIIRKAKVNELAFYMMHPDKLPKKEENGPESTPEEVVQKA